MQIFAISGSLRSGSSNTALLEAARLVAPPGIEVEIYDRLAELPAFNPDQDTMEGDSLPAEAAKLRERVGRAHAILICSPEYAHGIPGSLKNLLDWLVGSVEFPGKPVAILRANARSVHGHAQLVEVLTTMNGQLIEEASVVVPLPPKTADAHAVLADAASSAALRSGVDALVRAIRQGEATPA